MTPKTSLGFALVEFADEVVGVPLLPWQKWLAIHALELLPDGTFRFRTVLMLVARQNGKSTFLQILALFFLYVRGVALVIGTAQSLDIAEEVWRGAVEIAEDVPELAAEIEHINRTNGKKALELRRGERYKVQAANRRGGRGLSGDLVLLDELREHQNWDAWGAVTKTTLARQYAQVWAASNAGDSNSVVLEYLRAMAHAAIGDPDGLQPPSEQPLEPVEDDSLGIFEWSAPPGCPLDDWDGIVHANPSLNISGLTERAILAARRTDPESVYRTEVLCQWVDNIRDTVIPQPLWDACREPHSEFEGAPVFAVEVSEDRRWASVGAAGWTRDGRPQVEVWAHERGTAWIVPWLLEREALHHPSRIMVDPASPAGSVLADAAGEGLTIEPVSGREYAQACGLFYDDVVEGRLVHLGDPLLVSALAGAVRRPTGDAWVWSRKRSTSVIAPLVAVTLARWALPAPGAGESVYEGRGLLVLG